MKKIPVIILLLLLLSCLTRPVYAQLGGACKSNELDTAIGCINVTDFGTFAGFLLPWIIGIAGGIAFFFILFSVLLITTSAGDPKKLQAGQEQLTSAVMGLVLVVFSIFLLRVVGYDVFKIPGIGP
jgi:hypothetical protein